MIKSITVTNKDDESLFMDLYNPYDTGIVITDITGIGPQKATLNTTDLVTVDGSVLNSARVSTRNIVFSFQLLPDPKTNLVETVRHRVYQYFPLKSLVTLKFVTDNRELYIQGYVESDEPDIFKKDETVQVSIICTSPWFYIDFTDVPMSGAIPKFEFPFSNESLYYPLIEFGDVIERGTMWVDYRGDIDTGGIFRLVLNEGTATGLCIENTTTDEVMTIDTSNIGEMMGSEKKMIRPLIYGEAATYNGAIYAIDGYGSKFDGDDWSTISMPTTIQPQIAVIYNGYLYIITSYDDRKVYRFDGSSFAHIYTFGRDFYGAAGDVFNGKIHTIGGQGYEKSLNDGQWIYYTYNGHGVYDGGSGDVVTNDFPYNFYNGSVITGPDGLLHVFGSDRDSTDYTYEVSGLTYQSDTQTYVENKAYCKTPIPHEPSSTTPYYNRYQAIVYNGALYLLGGPTGTYFYKYDSNGWVALPDLPRLFMGKCSACVFNSKIYIYGGNDGVGHVSNYLFEWDGYRWAEVLHDSSKATPPSLGNCSLIVYGNNMYAIGGNNHDNNWYYSKSVYRVDFITYEGGTLFTCVRIGSLPVKSADSFCWNDVVAKDNNVYAILDDGQLYRGTLSRTSCQWTPIASPLRYDTFLVSYKNDIYAYSLPNGMYVLRGNAWERAGTTTNEINYIGPKSAVVYRNNLCLMDTDHYIEVSNSRKHYTFDGSVWTEDADLPYDCWNASVVIYRGEIHLLGGGEGLNSHYRYDHQDHAWHFVSTLPYSHIGGDAVVYDDKIHLLGGQLGDTYYNHYIWDGVQWKTNKDSKLQPGDMLYLSTVPGNKYFRGYRNGKTYNILSALPRVTDWIHFKKGDNLIKFTAATGRDNVSVDLSYRELYEGV